MGGPAADRKRHPVQDILNLVFDEATNSLKINATLEVSDIQIGAVEIKDHNGDDRVIVDTDHRMLTRALMQVGGSDLSALNPAPITITDSPVGYSGGLWRFGLDAETIGLMTALGNIQTYTENLRDYVLGDEDSILNGAIEGAFGDGSNDPYLAILVEDGPTTSGFTSLWDVWSGLEALQALLQPNEGWMPWSGTLPALPTVVTLDYGDTGKLWDITNDDAVGTGASLEYSFDNSNWQELKPGETVTRTVWAQYLYLRATAGGTAAYRVDCEGEA